MKDVTIIGSGFAAQEIAATLSRHGMDNFEIIDLSRTASGEPVIAFECSENSVFDSEQANATAGLGGGIQVWGGAITIPNSRNVFSNPRGSWAEVGLKLTPLCKPEQYFPNYRKPRWRKVVLARMALNNLLTWKTKIQLDCGHYSSPIRSGFGPKKETGSSLQSFQTSTGTLVSIETSEDGTVSLTTNCVGLGTREIKSKYVVFASGTFLNAAMVSRLNGAKRFPLGNHPSRTVATVSFPGFRWLGPSVQELRPGDREFFTLHLTGQYSESVGINQSSLRLIPDVPPIAGAKGFEVLLARILHRFRFYKRVHFREMLAQELRDANYMEVVDFKDGKFRVYVRLELDDRDKRASGVLLREVLGSPMLRSCYIRESEEGWSDAAHYFGTLNPEFGPSPMITPGLTLAGTPSIFICGLSSVSKLAHIHPTLLVLSQARFIGEELVRRLGDEISS